MGFDDLINLFEIFGFAPELLKFFSFEEKRKNKNFY